MNLDTIIYLIKIHRKHHENPMDHCPFSSAHEYCVKLFPEISSIYPRCPCHVLGSEYVAKEMQRLFP